MAAVKNKDALCKTQLVFQNINYHTKHGSDKPTLAKEVCLSKPSERDPAVDQKVRSLQIECDNLKEELEGQRLLNEALMIENDNIDTKWRALVTESEHKFQACKKRLHKHSHVAMSSEEHGLNRQGNEKLDGSEHTSNEQGLHDDRLAEDKQTVGTEMSNGEYQQTRISNGLNADAPLDVASAVADKENAEVQEEMILLREKKTELQSFCDTLSKNQELLLRALEEKERDVIRVNAAAKEREEENAALKRELSQAVAKSSELDKTLSSVQDENKELKSELQTLRGRLSELEGSNVEQKNIKDADREQKDAAAQGETKSEQKASVKSTDGVVLREGKSRTAPNFYRHSIAAGSLPRPFIDFSAPERKRSVGADSRNADNVGAPSFLQRKVNASYLNAFKPRPFSYKPVNFNVAKKGPKEEEEEKVEVDSVKDSDAKECKEESNSQASQEPQSRSSAPEESQGAQQQEATNPTSDVIASVDHKARIQYESDEDEDLMTLKARNEDVGNLVNLWNTKTEVTDV